MSKIPPINESQLDGLLNRIFLETNAEEADLLSAQFVLAQDYGATMTARQEQRLLKKLEGKSGGGSGWKTILLLLLTGITITLTVLFFPGKQEEQSTGAVAVSRTGDTTSAGEGGEGRNPSPRVANGETAIPVKKNNTPPPGIFSDPLPPSAPPLFSAETTAPLPPAQSRPFSEEEESFFSRVKARLLDKIRGIDEHIYTRVEEGKVKYAGKSTPVDAFVIRNFAVTNLEYNAFLSDLLKNGRTADYETARMRSGNWKNQGCDNLAASYASDKRYRDFPAVNISPEGAALFCRWLEEQLNAQAQGKKTRRLTVRLPYDYEWIYAAKTGYAEVPDCSGYNTIYDPKEGLVDQAFVRRLVKVKTADRSAAQPVDALFSLNRYGMSESAITAIFEKGIGYAPPLTDSVDYNRVAALNKAGHVSEIIRNREGKTVVMGSCWKSKEEYQQMLADFNAQSGSPFVGFRVVIMNADKGTFKNPFW